MFTGIDIVEIRRMEKIIERHGTMLNRFFTARELMYCRSRGVMQAASFSGIFAAKEAFFKALGTGFRQGKWNDVEVDHDEYGAPFFRLKGVHAELAAQRSSHQPALSISHDGAYAIAQVIWE